MIYSPQRTGAQDESLQIETLHEDADTLVELTEHVLLGDEDILKDQFAGIGAAHAELVQLTRARETLEALLNDKGRDALGAFLGLGLGVDDDEIRVGALWSLVVRSASVPLLLSRWRSLFSVV